MSKGLRIGIAILSLTAGTGLFAVETDTRHYAPGMVLDLSQWQLSESLSCHTDIVTNANTGKTKTITFPKLSKLIKEHGGGLFFEWPKSTPFYDKANVTSAYIEGNSIAGYHVPDTRAFTLYPKFKGLAVAGCAVTKILSGPKVDSYSAIDGIPYNGPVAPGGIVQLHGRYFGTKAPKAWLEYPTAKGRIKKLGCYPQKPNLMDDMYGNHERTCMDPFTGESRINFRIPLKYPKDFVHGDTVVMVIDNGISIDSLHISTINACPDTWLEVGRVDAILKHNVSSSGVLTIPVLTATDANGQRLVRDPYGAKLTIKKVKTLIPRVATFSTNKKGEVTLTFKKYTGGIKTHVVITVVDKVSKRTADLQFYVMSDREDRFPEAMERLRDDFVLLQSDGSAGGFAVMIDDGEYYFADGYGNQGVNDEPPTDLTIFPMGTMSELFSATATLYLAQQKKLKITHKMVDYMQGANWRSADKAVVEKVQLIDLMSHTSGIDGSYLPYSETRIPALCDSFMKNAFAHMLKHKTFEKRNNMVRHSSDNYVLLHRVIEETLRRKTKENKESKAISDKPGYRFSEYVANRIFRKELSMKNTYHWPFNTPDANYLARGYTAVDTRYRSLPPLYANNPAGAGFYSTPLDLCRLARGLMPKPAVWGEIPFFGIPYKISSREGLLKNKWADKMEKKYPTGDKTFKIGDVVTSRGLGWDEGQLTLFGGLDLTCCLKIGETAEHVSVLLNSRSANMAVALCVIKPADANQVSAIAQRFLIQAICQKEKAAANKLERYITSRVLNNKIDLPGKYSPTKPTTVIQKKFSGIFANGTDVYRLKASDVAIGSHYPLTMYRKKHGTRGNLDKDWESVTTAKRPYRYRVGDKYAIGEPSEAEKEYEPAIISPNNGTGDYIVKYSTDKVYGINKYYEVWMQRPPMVAEVSPSMFSAWAARTDTWLLVNDHYLSGSTAESPFFTLQSAESIGDIDQNLKGYVLLNNGAAEMLLAIKSRDELKPNLTIPGDYGSGMRPVKMEMKGSEEWMTLDDLLARPASGCPVITDSPLTLTVGSDLHWEWARLDTDLKAVYVRKADDLSSQKLSRWMLFDAEFNLLADDLIGSDNHYIGTKCRGGYLVFKGLTGASATVQGVR